MIILAHMQWLIKENYFNLSINVSYKRLEIMLFRYCLNVILDVILEKHFWNSFRKKLNVDVFQFYFRCHPKDECLTLICFSILFLFKTEIIKTSCFFSKLHQIKIITFILICCIYMTISSSVVSMNNAAKMSHTKQAR